MAEGISGPERGLQVTPDSAAEHSDYKAKLQQIRGIYLEELENYERVSKVGGAVTHISSAVARMGRGEL